MIFLSLSIDLFGAIYHLKMIGDNIKSSEQSLTECPVFYYNIRQLHVTHCQQCQGNDIASICRPTTLFIFFYQVLKTDYKNLRL